MNLHPDAPGWMDQLLLTAHALEAAVLGGVIGWQREHVGREAGVRTFGAVALGSCLYGLVSHAAPDVSRISAQVVTGIGFLGAGIILKEGGHIIGLTTAATLWATAALGLVVAEDMHVLAVGITIFMLILLAIPVKQWEHHNHNGSSPPPKEPPLHQ